MPSFSSTRSFMRWTCLVDVLVAVCSPLSEGQGGYGVVGKKECVSVHTL